MSRILVSRFASVMLLAMTACLRVNAQTPTPCVPTVAFNQADGLTIHKSAGMVPVSITFTDTICLRSATLSGGYTSGMGYYRTGTPTASLRLSFYASYFPTGDYKFTANVYNTSGLHTTKSITLHLVP